MLIKKFKNYIRQFGVDIFFFQKYIFLYYLNIDTTESAMKCKVKGCKSYQGTMKFQWFPKDEAVSTIYIIIDLKLVENYKNIAQIYCYRHPERCDYENRVYKYNR